MRVLLTNAILAGGSGTETLVRDLALALRRRGHVVTCYAPRLGSVAACIRATGTAVIDSVATLGEPPDIIHGHHSGPTMVALARFTGTPAIFVCHDWSAIHDDPPVHPRIRRYLYVRHVLRERLVAESGIDPCLVRFWGNTIDLARVGPSRSPPIRPRTAGVYAHPGSVPYLVTLAAACRKFGIAFHGELLGDGRQAGHPENALSRCDLVFASGRMAIEALAAGCAVINADRFGVGGLVTAAELSRFISANFAIGALSDPVSESVVVHEIDRYDAADVAAVSDRVRRECDVVAGAERLEAIYRDVIADSAGRAAGGAAEQIALVRFLEQNLQRGVLYNRQLARQRFMSEPNDELVAMFDTLGGAVNELNRRVAELTSETRHLARFQPAAVFLELWRRARAGFRPRA